MGNVHTVTQAKPKFHWHGAVIQVRKGLEASFEKEFESFKVKDNAILQRSNTTVTCPNINEDSTQYNPDTDDLYVVIRSGSKYGYDVELNHVLHHFSHQLQDASFYIEDEYVRYIKLYEIRNGKFTMQTVVANDGDLVSYFRVNFPEDKHTLFQILKARAFGFDGILLEFEFSRSIQLANQALTLNLSDWSLLFLKGRAQICAKKFNAALKTLRLALKLKKESLPKKMNDFDCRQIYHSIALAHIHLKNYREGLKFSDIAQNIIPTKNDYRPLECKGFVLMELKQYNDAITCFDEILSKGARKTDIGYAFYNKACALSFLERWDQAAACLAAAFSLDRVTFPIAAKKDEALKILLHRENIKTILGETYEIIPKEK